VSLFIVYFQELASLYIQLFKRLKLSKEMRIISSGGPSQVCYFLSVGNNELCLSI
jgi:hypothetical protein